MKTPTTILAIASITASVNAHGYISQPKAAFEGNSINTNYNALTTASVNKAFAGGKFDGSPSDNTKVFNERWKKTGYKSLRDMADPIVPDCGKTLKTATPVDVSGYSEMWWQNDEYKEGFVASHEGPCEGWVDDEQIFYHENCAAKFKGYPAKVPADYSSCKGECLFVFYWFALHEPNWQIYKQCVPITNNGSGASTTTQSSGEKESSTSKDNGTSDTPASSDDGGSGATQTNTDNGTSDTPASVDNGGSDTTQTTTDSASDETQDGGSTENEGSGTEDEASGTDDEGSGAEQTTPAPESVEAPSTPSTEESNAPEPATPESPEVTPATPATDTTSTKCSARRRH